MFTTNDEPESLPTSTGAFWFFASLGVALATVALISLLTSAFEVALTGKLQGPLDAYRAAAHPLLHWGLGWLRALELPRVLQPPAWGIEDAYALSFAGGLLTSAWASPGVARRAHGSLRFLALLAMALVVGVTGLGFVILYIAADGFNFEFRDPDTRAVSIAILTPFLCAAAFFIANA